MNLILIFPSSHAALGAEQALLGHGLPVELIPVPRQIRSDCGFCLLAETGEAGTGEGERRLGLIRSCGALGLWRVLETQTSPASGKVKNYERYA